MTDADTRARVRFYVGDLPEESDPELTDETVDLALSENDANVKLAAADLRDHLESQSGDNFGPAWAARTKLLRDEASARGIRGFDGLEC